MDFDSTTDSVPSSQDGVYSLADAGLSCVAASGGSCTATGSVTIAAGSFVDLQMVGANGTVAGVWTALACN